MSAPPLPHDDDDEQAAGRFLMLVGLLVVAAGVVLCGYAVVSGGFEAGDPFGERSGSDMVAVMVGVFAVAGGGLLAALGAMVAKSVRRPRSHRSYGGAHLDTDHEEW